MNIYTFRSQKLYYLVIHSFDIKNIIKGTGEPRSFMTKCVHKSD